MSRLWVLKKSSYPQRSTSGGISRQPIFGDVLLFENLLETTQPTLLSGIKEWPDEDCHPRVERFMKSFAQDLMFGVSRGKIKPPQQILLPYAVKTLTNDVELIQMLNCCGHGIAYSQLEEINPALCLQKMASTSEIPLPDNIQPHVSTTLAWDNIDRLEI